LKPYEEFSQFLITSSVQNHKVEFNYLTNEKLPNNNFMFAGFSPPQQRRFYQHIFMKWEKQG